MTIVDTHCHAGVNWFEPVELLLAQMNANGVDKGALIQHRVGGIAFAALFGWQRASAVFRNSAFAGNGGAEFATGGAATVYPNPISARGNRI